MKTISFAIILSQAASAIAATEPFYLPARNATCTGHDDGNITCESGHVDGALVVEARDLGPAIRGREPDALDKRVTCGLPILGGASCAIHCAALNYCNNYCDDGICRCRCYDNSGKYKTFPCSRTTCS
ncbi:hypothetical protein V8F33_010421 [Rhypophila sp. PSN 637]